MLALPVLCPTSYAAAPPQQYAFADVRGGRPRRVNATWACAPSSACGTHNHL